MGRRKLGRDMTAASKPQLEVPNRVDKEILHLDGSTLEGGGQLVRNAVALSALTSQPIKISKIRANRSGRQGLKASHTAALQFLADVCGAHIIGAFVGSTELTFLPRREENVSPEGQKGVETVSAPSVPIKAKYDIRLPTPGSVFLVFQALYPFLLYAGASTSTTSAGVEWRLEPAFPAISLSITGGTNVSFSPSYDYIAQVLVPNFAKLGLPELSVRLHKRGWSTGHTEFGSVTFQIKPLSNNEPPKRGREDVDGTSVEGDVTGSTSQASTTGFPLFRLRDFERGSITQIDITILAPDNLVSESVPTRKDNKKKGMRGTHRSLESASTTSPSQTIRELLESETIEALEHALQHDDDAANQPIINIHTSEKTHHRTRVYLLLVAHTSTGMRLGYDVGPGISSSDALGGPKKGGKQGKKGNHPNDGGKRKKEESDGMEVTIRNMADRCVRGLMSEIAGGPDENEESEDEYDGSSPHPNKRVRMACVDKHMRDQVVVFEALGRAFAKRDGEEIGASDWAEEGGLTLHSRTAMWVCEQILGV
ncbi:hypothetical protein FQN54_007650 [Arachnomyces sp. PD_36]|nr:hypothetical protein FQN54_007650 [Arachnomyces sp. PD_36]